jgi:hypothetical protein
MCPKNWHKSSELSWKVKKESVSYDHVELNV